MEARVGDPAETRTSAEKLIGDLKTMIQKVEDKTVEQAKAADKIVREHPYPAIGIAFGLGLLVGILAGRR